MLLRRTLYQYNIVAAASGSFKAAEAALAAAAPISAALVVASGLLGYVATMVVGASSSEFPLDSV